MFCLAGEWLHPHVSPFGTQRERDINPPSETEPFHHYKSSRWSLISCFVCLFLFKSGFLSVRTTPTQRTSWCLWPVEVEYEVWSPAEETSTTPWESKFTITHSRERCHDVPVLFLSHTHDYLHTFISNTHTHNLICYCKEIKPHRLKRWSHFHCDLTINRSHDWMALQVHDEQRH